MINSTTATIVRCVTAGAALVALVVFVLMTPGLIYAATYQYVDRNGDVQMVNADTPMAAIASAPNIGIHSGVALYTDLPQLGGTAIVHVSVTSGTYAYHYIDINGIVQTVMANNAAEAFSKAVNIGIHSGVALDAGLLETGDTVAGY